VEIFFECLSRKKYYPVLDGAGLAIHIIEGGMFGALPNMPLLTSLFFFFVSPCKGVLSMVLRCISLEKKSFAKFARLW